MHIIYSNLKNIFLFDFYGSSVGSGYSGYYYYGDSSGNGDCYYYGGGDSNGCGYSYGFSPDNKEYNIYGCIYEDLKFDEK